MIHPSQDLGNLTKAADANASASSGAPVLILAGGTGDGVKITGQSIDRYASDGIAIADSVVVTTSYLAALADTKTLSLAHEVQYSADNSSWDTAVVIEASTVKATSSGGTNERGVDEHNLNLRGQKRYFRINVTPDLSATGTDTATFHTIATMGGYDKVPQ
jgi:hypothetical protein